MSGNARSDDELALAVRDRLLQRVRLDGDGFGGRAAVCRFGWYEVEASYVRAAPSPASPQSRKLNPYLTVGRSPLRRCCATRRPCRSRTRASCR